MVAQGNALGKRRFIVTPSANKCPKLKLDSIGRKAENAQDQSESQVQDYNELKH